MHEYPEPHKETEQYSGGQTPTVVS
uniref:Uncharacterized protein n=1 Tax=Arundo donax TaxID=35708 RepID=A0A0A8Z4W6_ARUDO